MKAHDNASSLQLEQFDKHAAQYFHFRMNSQTANDFIEIPQTLKMLGDLKGLSVLDAGCAFGYYSKYCAMHGAIVTAVDISRTQIDLCREYCREFADRIEFKVGDVASDEVVLEENSFDLVLSNISVHFSLDAFFRNCAKSLKKGGKLVYSQIHPTFSACNMSNGLNFEDYFRTDSRTQQTENIFGNQVVSDKYFWSWNHYTTEDVAIALRTNGFFISGIYEPKPVPNAPNQFKIFNRIPLFLFFEAVLA